MPATRSELKRYLIIAMLFFLAGMAALLCMAHFIPSWLNQFGSIPDPWAGVLNMLIGGVALGGLYTAGSFVARQTEKHGSSGVSSFNTGAYGLFILIAPLTFIPAMVIALRRLLSDDLPESPEEKPARVVRKELPRS